MSNEFDMKQALGMMLKTVTLHEKRLDTQLDCISKINDTFDVILLDINKLENRIQELEKKEFSLKPSVN
jgi:hypothetical protein